MSTTAAATAVAVSANADVGEGCSETTHTQREGVNTTTNCENRIHTEKSETNKYERGFCPVDSVVNYITK